MKSSAFPQQQSGNTASVVQGDAVNCNTRAYPEAKSLK